MKIILFYDPRYGKHRWVPDCKNSKCLAKLANRLTFSPEQLILLRENGYEMDLKSSPRFSIDQTSLMGVRR